MIVMRLQQLPPAAPDAAAGRHGGDCPAVLHAHRAAHDLRRRCRTCRSVLRADARQPPSSASLLIVWRTLRRRRAARPPPRCWASPSRSPSSILPSVAVMRNGCARAPLMPARRAVVVDQGLLGGRLRGQRHCGAARGGAGQARAPPCGGVSMFNLHRTSTCALAPSSTTRWAR